MFKEYSNHFKMVNKFCMKYLVENLMSYKLIILLNYLIHNFDLVLSEKCDLYCILRFANYLKAYDTYDTYTRFVTICFSQ